MVNLFLQIVLLLGLLSMGACTSKKYEINLMPAPELYAEMSMSPVDIDTLDSLRRNDEERGILYITSREPAENVREFPHYETKNAFILRAGRATIKFTDDKLTTKDLTEASQDSTLNGKYKLTIDSIYPMGHLPNSAHPLVFSAHHLAKEEYADTAFLSLLRRRIALSEEKSVTIFVHGFRVDFTYPLLIASQFWYFDGLDETYIAFSWPSTYKKYFAYFHDSETALTSGRDLRILIEYLLANTKVKEINIIGHSAGTRVVVSAANELAMLNHHLTHDDFLIKYKLNNIILLSGDASTSHLLGYPEGGALQICKKLSLYQSEDDLALKASRKLAKHYRIGQAFSNKPAEQKDSLLITTIKAMGDRLDILNCTAARGATKGNGHNYFWTSPWVSSDLIMLLRYGKNAYERGLIYNEEWGTWEFNDQYPERLKTSLENK